MTDKQNEKKTATVSTEIIIPDLFYHSLFKYNPDMVLFMDRYGIIVKLNKGFRESLGFKQKEVELHFFEKFLPPTAVDSYRELLKNTLNGTPQYTHTKVKSKSGKTLDVSIDFIPATREDKVIGTFLIAKDLTKVKKFEMELANSELKFNSIADDALVGIYILGEDSKVTYGNKRFFEIIGVSDPTEEVMMIDHIHPEDSDRLTAMSDTLMQSR